MSKYPAIMDCRRKGICQDVRECPVYRGMRERLSQALGTEGFETTEGMGPDASTIHFEGHMDGGAYRFFLMGYRHDSRKRTSKGKGRVNVRNCYISASRESGPEELERELQGMHAERRRKLMEEDG